MSAERLVDMLGALNERLAEAEDVAADLDDAPLDRALHATRGALALAGARAYRLSHAERRALGGVVRLRNVNGAGR